MNGIFQEQNQFTSIKTILSSMRKPFILLISFILFSSCKTREIRNFQLGQEVGNLNSIKGNPDNGEYLYVTAGNLLYSIGNQKGNFPEIGFHVEGEMGGIWYHPIKLLDAFQLSFKGENDNNINNLDNSDFIAHPFANQFKYEFPEQEISATRTDFVPDNLPVIVVEYEIHNYSSTSKILDLNMKIDSDLRPVWLGERSGMNDGEDQLIESTSNNLVIIKDNQNDWYVGISSDGGNLSVEKTSKSALKGKGVMVSLNLPKLKLNSGERKTVKFFIAGSTTNLNELKENLRVAETTTEKLYNEKRSRYETIEQTAKVTIPDTLFMKAYKWGKYNTDWLIRDIPGLGRGLNAGLPDYPWFFSNDQAITFQGLLGTMEPDLFYDSWEMMKQVSDEYNDGSGQIIHEVSTNGAVYDGGRMEESQLFIIAAWEIFKWYGDIDFLKTYYEHGKKVWEFLQKNDKDNNLYVEGYGGTEIKGLNDEMLDVAVETYAFLEVMAQAAEVVGEQDNSEEFSEKAAMLKQKINDEWWSKSENRYFDFIAPPAKALNLIDMALEERVEDGRNKWAKKKLLDLKEDIESGTYDEKGFTVFYNASTLSPLTSGIADTIKAVQMLETMPFFTNKYGLYVAGIARPDDISSEEGSVAFRLEEEFNYNEAIMTAGTNKLILAAAKYKGIDSAYKYIQQVLNNFSFATPGTTYEVSPDYGMFVQAWNVNAFNIPIIHYIFGVDPFAYKREINIHPDIPTGWDFAKLENLLIGENSLSIDFKRENRSHVFTVESEKENWTIYFKLPDNVSELKLNGEQMNSELKELELKGKGNVIEYVINNP